MCSYDHSYICWNGVAEWCDKAQTSITQYDSKAIKSHTVLHTMDICSFQIQGGTTYAQTYRLNYSMGQIDSRSRIAKYGTNVFSCHYIRYFNLVGNHSLHCNLELNLLKPRADWRSSEKGMVVRQIAFRPLAPSPFQCSTWRYPSAVHANSSFWRVCRLGWRRRHAEMSTEVQKKRNKRWLRRHDKENRQGR